MASGFIRAVKGGEGALMTSRTAGHGSCKSILATAVPTPASSRNDIVSALSNAKKASVAAAIGAAGTGSVTGNAILEI